MNFIDLILDFLNHNIILLSVVSGFFSEDIFLFIFVFASIENANPIYIAYIVILGLIGMAIYDTLVYLAVNTKIAYKIRNKIKIPSNFSALKNRFGDRYFVPLLFSKFIYGVRTAGVILASTKEKNFGKFILYNTLADVIWMLIMLPIGWVMGNEFLSLLGKIESIEKIILILFVVVAIIYLFSKLFKFEAKIYSNSKRTQV